MASSDKTEMRACDKCGRKEVAPASFWEKVPRVLHPRCGGEYRPLVTKIGGSTQ